MLDHDSWHHDAAVCERVCVWIWLCCDSEKKCCDILSVRWQLGVGGMTYITDKIQISKYRIDVLTFENFDFDTDFSARLFILSVCVTDKHPAHLRSTYWFTYKYALRLMCCCVLSPWQIDHLCYLQTCLCCLDHACLTSNQLLINEHMRSLHK